MIKIQKLDYQPDSAALFRPLADQPGSIFLDSHHGRNQTGRFDILSAFPVLTLTAENGNTFLYRNKLKTLIDENPLVALNTYFKQYQCPFSSHLPFHSGFLGYLAYDLVHYLEPLPSQRKIDIKLPDMVMGLYAWAWITDHEKKETYWVINEYLTQEQKNWLSYKEQLTIWLNSLSGHKEDPFFLTQAFTADWTAAEYAEKFKAVQFHLRQGDCYQINLTQRFSAGYQGSLWTAYKKTRTQMPTPFSAFLNLNPNQAILCHSPERFLFLNDRRIETSPIKGTAPRAADPEQDRASAHFLLNSQKDRAENVMIVDLLRNDIGKVSEIGSVHVSKLCALESFSNVHHLVSTIQSNLLKTKTPIDLLAACFPGGSITGAPKYRVMQIIEALESTRRSLYCGTLGFIDLNGNMDTNIIIRTLLADHNKIYSFAGGGIVIDSECESEYQECWSKIQSLFRALAS